MLISKEKITTRNTAVAPKRAMTEFIIRIKVIKELHSHNLRIDDISVTNLHY